MGVDDGDADGNARAKPEFLRGLDGETAADGLAHRCDARADAAELLGGEVAEPDLAEIRGVPAGTALVPEVGPLADRGAERAGVVTGGAVGEEVRQVEEARGAAPRGGEVFLQPEELGRLHLGRDHAADVAEHGVARAVDAFGLRDGAVIHPDDDILRGLAGGTDGHGPVLGVEHDERAGGVEADAGDVRRRSLGRLQRAPHGAAARGPDVGGGMLHEVRRGPEEQDGLGGVAEHAPGGGEHAGARAAGADVDAQEKWGGHGRRGEGRILRGEAVGKPRLRRAYGGQARERLGVVVGFHTDE